MIEKSTLPDRIARPGRFDRPCEDPLQSSNPIAELNFIWQRYKQVQVIGKNHVAPNRNAEIVLSAFAEFYERVVNLVGRKMRPPPIRAVGYEVKRTMGKDNIQPPRRSGEFCHGLL